jgi:HPt (histidine-containing phosphotransfer) domain-containing protein
MGGESSLLRTCTGLFIEDYPKRLKELQEALAADEVECVASTAHTLKGAISVFSNGPALQAVRTIERLAKDRDLATARQVYAVLDSELDRLKHALEAFAAEGLAA